MIQIWGKEEILAYGNDGEGEVAISRKLCIKYMDKVEAKHVLIKTKEETFSKFKLK